MEKRSQISSQKVSPASCYAEVMLRANTSVNTSSYSGTDTGKTTDGCNLAFQGTDHKLLTSHTGI